MLQLSAPSGRLWLMRRHTSPPSAGAGGPHRGVSALLPYTTAEMRLKTRTMDPKLWVFFLVITSLGCLETYASFGLSCRFSGFIAAPEEKRARGAAGGRDPGLREDSHGEEQPPERPRQDGQTLVGSPPPRRQKNQLLMNKDHASLKHSTFERQ